MGEVGEEVGYITTLKQQLCHAHFKSNRRPSSTPERQETREKKRQRLESRRLAKGRAGRGRGIWHIPAPIPGTPWASEQKRESRPIHPFVFLSSNLSGCKLQGS